MALLLSRKHFLHPMEFPDCNHIHQRIGPDEWVCLDCGEDLKEEVQLGKVEEVEIYEN